MRLFVKDGKDHVGGWTQRPVPQLLRDPAAAPVVAVRGRHPGRRLHRRSAAAVLPRRRGAGAGGRPDHPVRAVAELGARRSTTRAPTTPSTSSCVRSSKPTGAAIKVMLSGDLHHYARYANEERELIHCGGGGAYLYPTHRMPEQITVPQPASLSRKTSEPPAHVRPAGRPSRPRRSPRGTPPGVFGRLPRRNLGFVGAARHPSDAVDVLDARAVRPPSGQRADQALAGTSDRHLRPADPRRHAYCSRSRRPAARSTPAGGSCWACCTASPRSALGVLGTWACGRCSALPHTPGRGRCRLTVGLPRRRRARLDPDVLRLPAGRQRVRGERERAVLRRRRIIDSKSFLRLHIDPTGKLTIYPIAVPRVSRSWRAPIRQAATGTQLLAGAAGNRSSIELGRVADRGPSTASFRSAPRRPGGIRTPTPGCTSSGSRRRPSGPTTASRGTLCPTTRPSPSGVVTRSPMRRRARLELLVERVLVLQAAHQPAAGAGDAQRVERQVLVLGHPDADRLEVGQERGAAQVAPARADPALYASRVAGGELAQLDPAVQGRAEVADERRGSRPDGVR